MGAPAGRSHDPTQAPAHQGGASLRDGSTGRLRQDLDLRADLAGGIPRDVLVGFAKRPGTLLEDGVEHHALAFDLLLEEGVHDDCADAGLFEFLEVADLPGQGGRGVEEGVLEREPEVGCFEVHVGSGV